MPSKSKKQAKLMAAVAHNPQFAKKVGVPQSVGREFNNADRVLKKYAKGGKVKTVRDLKEALATWKENKLPQEGFFSTLDELVATAPDEVMPAYMWQNYLKPGRMLDREGVKFPLKQEELNYSGISRLPEIGGVTPDPDRKLTKEQVREWARKSRPDIASEVRTSQTYPGQPIPDYLRAHTAQPRYDESGLRHDPSIPGSYEESITVSPDVGDFTSHFSPQDISWSRTTRHEVPSTRKLAPGTSAKFEGDSLRLIEEIQSDRHSAAGEKINLDLPPGLSDAERAARPIGRRGYRTSEQEQELIKLREKGMRLSVEDLTRRGVLSKIPPDAPFKDPRDYATLETRKQLLNAVRENDRFLGITRGKDQIDRYEQGMDERRSGGMEKMYDEVYPSVLKKEAGRYGAQMSDVDVPIKVADDMRPPAFVDVQAETLDDYFTTIEDMHDYASIGEIVDAYRPLLRNYSTLEGDDALSVVKKAENKLKEVQGLLQKSEVNHLGWASKAIDAEVELQTLMTTLHRMWMHDKASSGSSINKSFPAAELTPDVADRIRRIGVPIFNAAGAGVLGSQFLPEEEEDMSHPGFAKGGKVDDESWADTYLKRPLSGLASMWGGTDPESGEFISPAWHNLKRAWNADERRRQGLPPQQRASLGLIDETLALPALSEIVGVEPPEFAARASDRADATRSAARDTMGLDAPHGFTQNLAESAGVMAGQMPIPASIAKKLGMLKGRSSKLGKIASSPVEWFSPTVVPSAGNYALGTAFGGILGGAVDHLGDYLEGEEQEAQQKQWIAEAMEEVLAEELGGEEDDDAALAELGYAEGGKVKAAASAARGIRKVLEAEADPATRKALLDEAVRSVSKPGVSIPKTARDAMHRASAGRDETGLLALLENTAPLLGEARPLNLDPARIVSNLPAPDPVRPAAPPLGFGTWTPEEYDKHILKKASGGLVGYAPAPQALKDPINAASPTGAADPRGAPLSQEWYENYGAGPEHQFFGERRLPELKDWSPIKQGAAQTPQPSGGSSTLSNLMGLGALGLMGYDAYKDWKGKDASGLDPESLVDPYGQPIDISGTNDWIQEDFDSLGMPTAEFDPTAWERTQQGAGGALDLYIGSQQGGVGGAGSMLSGGADVYNALGGSEQIAERMGTVGSMLSNIGDGTVQGYLSAGGDATQLASAMGYEGPILDAAGKFLPVVGQLFSAYEGIKQGNPAGYAQAAGSLYGAASTAGLTSSTGALASSGLGTAAPLAALGFLAADLGNKWLGTGKEVPYWNAAEDYLKDNPNLGIRYDSRGRIGQYMVLPSGRSIKWGNSFGGGTFLRDAILQGNHQKAIDFLEKAEYNKSGKLLTPLPDWYQKLDI